MLRRDAKDFYILLMLSSATVQALKHKQQKTLYSALQRLKEELMLLGFISFILSLSQSFIVHICIPETATHFMLPCKRENHKVVEEGAIVCKKKGDVPFLSLEALHQLHIFIFVLGLVHVVFCATTIFLGGAQHQPQPQHPHASTQFCKLFVLVLSCALSELQEMLKLDKHWKAETVEVLQTDIVGNATPLHVLLRRNHQRELVIYLQLDHKGLIHSMQIAFSKQFHDSVGKSDYEALRSAFVLIHYPSHPNFDFHKYMTRALEHDFKRVVGISWYLWLFVILFLLLNINGWHTYFWLAFLPLFVTYGFDSCIMEKKAYAISRLVIGLIIQVVCSYITLPLYAIVTHMSGDIKLQALGSGLHESVANWATGARKRGRSETSLRNSLTLKKTGATDPVAGRGDSVEIPVARAPNEHFGSSRNMLGPAVVPDLDEIVSVVDNDSRR
uniref:MLO-like protein n=1 Tax=Aegilops tauschii TaxID=37682 RepID=N1QSX4_AEGTA